MSEIGLKDYLRILDKLILLQDQRGFPANLETGDVKPVFDISRFIPENNVRTVFWEQTVPVAGSGELESPILSAGDDGSYDLVGKNARLFGLGVIIRFTVAGALAAVGNRISVGWSTINRTAGNVKEPFSENQLENGKLIIATILEYRFFFGASHNTSVFNQLPNNLVLGPKNPTPNASPGNGLAITQTITTGVGAPALVPAGTVGTVYATFYETDQPLIPPL